MKKLFVTFPVLFSIIIIAGCSTKFNVGAPYKNITIINALLDARDTAHYIRIQKAFLDQNKNALVMAQNPDSNFYPNLDVKVELIDQTTGNIFNTIHLTKVDLNLEGYQKDSGAFFNSPNYAYKFKNSLDPSFTYRVVVTNPATGEVDSAETPIIEDRGSAYFSMPIIDATALNLLGLDFSSTGENQYVEITASYKNYTQATNPVGVAEGIVTFNWVDSNTLTHAKTPRSYNFDLGYAPLSGDNIDYKENDVSFYAALNAGMGTAPTNIVRLLSICQISMYLGTSDFYNYEQTISTQGIGLTGSEIEPVYTNIKGANVLGLYTARGFRGGNIQLTPGTVDSLVISPLVANCKIVGTAY